MVDATTAAASERLTICCIFYFNFSVFLLLLFGIAYATKDWNERNPKIGTKCVRCTLLVSLLLLILTLTRCMCTKYLLRWYRCVLLRVCVALCERVRRKRCSEVKKTKEIAVWLGFVALFRAFARARTQSALRTLAHGKQMAVSRLLCISVHAHNHDQCVFSATISHSLSLSPFLSSLALCFLLAVIWSMRSIASCFTELISNNWFIRRIASHQYSCEIRMVQVLTNRISFGIYHITKRYTEMRIHFWFIDRFIWIAEICLCIELAHQAWYQHNDISLSSKLRTNLFYSVLHATHFLPKWFGSYDTANGFRTMAAIHSDWVARAWAGEMTQCTPPKFVGQQTNRSRFESPLSSSSTSFFFFFSPSK